MRDGSHNLKDLAELCATEDWLMSNERLMIVSPAGGSAAMYDNMTSFVRAASPAAVLALYERIEQLPRTAMTNKDTASEQSELQRYLDWYKYAQTGAEARNAKACIASFIKRAALQDAPLSMNHDPALVEAYNLGFESALIQQATPETPASEQQAKCWSCKKPYTLEQRADADGNCPHCGVEIELTTPAATTASAPCTCPSGDGSLRWPCPVHPSEATTISAEMTADQARSALQAMPLETVVGMVRGATTASASDDDCEHCNGVGYFLDEQGELIANCPECEGRAPEPSREAAPQIQTWQSRCDWTSDEPATKLMVAAMKDEISELRAALARRAAVSTTGDAVLSEADVQWVVNDIAELGVKIGNQFFFLYKGDSLVYEDATHDDGSPMHWRPVFKREFGECAHPINHADYSKIGTVSLSDSDEWQPLPAAPQSPTEEA